jgi:hypothetical protein
MERIIRSRKSIIVFAFALVLLIGISINASAATYYSIASTNWNVNTTWSTVGYGGAAASAFPVAGDIVNIGGGFTVTVNVASACASIQFGQASPTLSAGSLTFSNSSTLTVSGAVLVGNNISGSSGTITFTSGSTLTALSLRLGGTVTGATGTITMTLGGTLSLGGALTVGTGSGTWTRGAGTVIFTDSNTLPSTVFTTFNNLQINGGTTTTGANIAPTSLTIGTSGTFATASTHTVTAANITINGTYTNASTGAITVTSWNVGSTGTYNHASTRSAFPLGSSTNSWAATSNFNVTGFTGSVNPTNFANMTFGNFEWNCTGQTSGSQICLFPVAGTTNIQGNFTIASTGSGTLYMRLSGLQVAGSINVAGNFSMTGGTFDIHNGGATPTTESLNLGGNFSMTGGNLKSTTTQSGSLPQINFTGSVIHLFTKTAGTITSPVSPPLTFNVLSGSTLQMGTVGGTVSNLDGANVAFNLQSGATLGVTSPAGISSTVTTGNIQVTGTRTYSPTANYIYNGTGAQSTGNSLTSAANITVTNSHTVTFTSSIAMSGNLSINTGSKVNLGAFTTHTAGTLTLGGAGQTQGIWGSTSSSATYTSDTYFDTSGAGRITITNPTCANYTWVGTTSQDWSTGANWCGKSVPPTISDDVIIPSGTPNQPLISSSALCKSITINSGATLTINTTNTLQLNGNWSNSGTFTPNSSTVTFNATSAISGSSTNSFYNLTISGSVTLTAPSGGTINIANNLTNSGTFIPNGGTVNFNGAAQQTITGVTTFNNLTINNTSGVQVAVSSNITINGILNLAVNNPSSTHGLLEMVTDWKSYPAYSGTPDYTDLTSSILTMASGSSTTGIGDVSGIVRRTVISASTSYTFGNQYTTIYLQPESGAVMPSTLTVIIKIGTAPYTDKILRSYEIIPSNNSVNCTVSANFHYLDGELGSNTESNLVTWDFDIGGGFPTPDEHGRAAYDFTNNYVGLSNVGVDYFIWASSGHAWRTIFTLGDYGSGTYYTWNGSVSSSWSDVLNWTLPHEGSGIPNSASSVIIPNLGTTANYPALPSSLITLSTVTIEQGGSLNMGSYTLTIANQLSAGWEDQNPGGNDPGTSTVIFANAGATVSGTGRFYNVEIGTGASLTNAVGSTMIIQNTITKTGSWYPGINGGTVEYSGAAQSIVVPDGSPEYYNLALNGSGTKTLSGSVQSVNLDISSGTALWIGSAQTLNVTGILTNGAGTAGLVVKSGAQLFYDNSVIDGTVELSLAGASAHFFVPPVNSMTIYSGTYGSPVTKAVNASDIAASLGLLHPEYFVGDLLAYSESAALTNQDLGWQYFNGYTGAGGIYTSFPFYSISNSRGYLIYLSATDVISIKGALSAPQLSFNIPRTTGCYGWNLVGNPYPCNFNLKGVPELSTAGNGVDNTIYVTQNNSYVTVNVNSGDYTNWPEAWGRPTNSTSPIVVPPMQGFFVHATSPDKSLTFPATSKSNSAVLSLAKRAVSTETTTIQKVKLALGNSNGTDETIVGLYDKATTGFDGSLDAYKLFGNNLAAPLIYTELSTVKYAVNYVPDPVTEPVVFPITVDLKVAGTYDIDVTQFENLDGTSVILRHGVVETDISKTRRYTFTLSAGVFKDFELIIGGSLTSIEKPAGPIFKTWYKDNFLYVICSSDIASDNGSLTVYDTQGKAVYQNSTIFFSPGHTIQIPISLPKGVYVTRVMIKSKTVVSKVVVI